MSIVSTEWLKKNINKIKLLECSWHMPNADRDSYSEYLNEHIPGAKYFDLDDNSNKNTDLPHMLPSKSRWNRIISSFGIKNNDEIVIYDRSDIFSSCRCWYNFIYFGHNKKLVHVLDGGFEKWLNEGRETTSDTKVLPKSNYTSNEKFDLVKSIEQINKNITSNEFVLIDGRSMERFNGSVAEPRKGLKSGCISNSICMPYKSVLRENKTFKNKSDLYKLFNEALKSKVTNKVVFSCGSGITACVLALAYSLINNNYTPTIYDGSWAEYGKTI